MMQTALVDMIVLIAACYAAIKFTPRVVRERLAPHLAALCTRLHLPSAWVRRLEQKVATAGGCGSCNSCNACATDPVAEPSVSQLHGIPIKVESVKRS
jgi:hypothetical protein